MRLCDHLLQDWNRLLGVASELGQLPDPFETLLLRSLWLIVQLSRKFCATFLYPVLEQQRQEEELESRFKVYASKSPVLHRT